MLHIGKVLGFGGMLAILAMFGSTDALAQKKKKNGKAATDYPVAADADYKAIQKQKELYGKLVAVDTTNLTIRVEYYNQQPNPKYKPPKNTGNNSMINQQNQIYRAYNDLQLQMQRAANARTPQQAMQAQQRINQDMIKLQQRYNQLMVQMAKAGTNTNPNNQPFMIVTTTKDFDLEVTEKCVYRKLNLPFEYDDTGNVKTYTKEEKEKLRGEDRTLPGYIAKVEELTAGQDIKLSLVPPKKKEKDKDADKEKDKDAPKEPEEVLRPTIKMIVITKDLATPTIQGDDGKNKKKAKK